MEGDAGKQRKKKRGREGGRGEEGCKENEEGRRGRERERETERVQNQFDSIALTVPPRLYFSFDTKKTPDCCVTAALAPDLTFPSGVRLQRKLSDCTLLYVYTVAHHTSVIAIAAMSC